MKAWHEIEALCEAIVADLAEGLPLDESKARLIIRIAEEQLIQVTL